MSPNTVPNIFLRRSVHDTYIGKYILFSFRIACIYIKVLKIIVSSLRSYSYDCVNKTYFQSRFHETTNFHDFVRCWHSWCTYKIHYQHTQSTHIQAKHHASINTQQQLKHNEEIYTYATYQHQTQINQATSSYYTN